MSVWVHLVWTVHVLTKSIRIGASVNQGLQEYIVKQVKLQRSENVQTLLFYFHN